MKKNSLILFICTFCVIIGYGQEKTEKDKGVFVSYKKGYYHNSILKGISDFETAKQIEKPIMLFRVDAEGKKYPTDIDLYTTVKHIAPVSQGNTGTCWCYAATSYMESEVYRMQNLEIDLSEMFTVYWEYVERAADFVETRGETYFAQGSEANAIPKIWRKYGIVPLKDFTGKPDSLPFHTHTEMVQEMKQFLSSIKASNNWNKVFVSNCIKLILNKYMGTPPDSVLWENSYYTPLEFMQKVIKMPVNDYFSFMSIKEFTYFERHELVEADNWWHGDNYYNLPISDYFDLIKKSIEKGYGVCICGDVSEPGFDRFTEACIIPSFDIPAEYIDDDARTMRLKNGSTTDDHCMHLVGYFKDDSGMWFLIKDSGSGAFDGEHKGYRFMHEDYIKLKIMNIMIHKNIAALVLDKIIK